jgi:hypothetical protein
MSVKCAIERRRKLHSTSSESDHAGQDSPFLATSQFCSRQASRTAIYVIQNILQPRLAQAKYTLPEECPLDPEQSVFKLQEAHKTLVRKGVWSCKYDAKVLLDSVQMFFCHAAVTNQYTATSRYHHITCYTR